MNITSFCIRRPVTTSMFFLILTLLGIISASRMAIDLYPEITYPVINISTSYSGAGPEEVEQLVTIPIERTVSTINNVRSITSVSSEGFSRVSVYFDWGTNLEATLDAIRANSGPGQTAVAGRCRHPRFSVRSFGRTGYDHRPFRPYESGPLKGTG